MADSFKRILQSGLFTFLVGEEERPYIVHAASIANQSRAFDTMINGNFKGRESKTETLQDVDEDTFSRFCEFAYKGDYCPPVFEFEEDKVIENGSDVHVNGDVNSDAMDDPPPSEPPVPEDTPDPPPPEPPDDWSRGWRNPSQRGEGNTYPGAPPREEWLRQEFLERKYSTTDSIDATIGACTPVRNKNHNEKYLPVFLGHARLYVFAEKYDVQPLRQLALKKLHQTLTIFELYAERIGDVVALVNYTYENTLKRPVIEELRDLVVAYVVSELEKISGGEFDELLGAGGDFVIDFWHKIKGGMLESLQD